MKIEICPVLTDSALVSTDGETGRVSIRPTPILKATTVPVLRVVAAFDNGQSHIAEVALHLKKGVFVLQPVMIDPDGFELDKPGGARETE